MRRLIDATAKGDAGDLAEVALDAGREVALEAWLVDARLLALEDVESGREKALRRTRRCWNRYAPQ